MLTRFGKRAVESPLAVYVLSFLPVVGRFVLPAASFYTFRKSVGTPPAIAIFAHPYSQPRRYLVMFLQLYFSSRTLTRELVSVRICVEIEILTGTAGSVLPPRQPPPPKRSFGSRTVEGVLFGFAITFTLFVRIPLVGVLIYGIAEASTAYLITKITDPPPPPAEEKEFVEKQIHWKNKHEFISFAAHAFWMP